jgi:DNA repair photolyase
VRQYGQRELAWKRIWKQVHASRLAQARWVGNPYVGGKEGDIAG